MENKNTRRGNTQESSYVGRGFPAERAVWPLTNQRSTTAANCWAKPNLHKRHAGFTLIELLVVVLIIGILAAVAVPQYQVAVEKSRAAEALTIMSSLQKAVDLYLLEQPPNEHIYLLGNSADGKGKLNIDVSDTMDCSPDSGEACSSKTFVYHVQCDTDGECFIDAERVQNGDYENNGTEYYLTLRRAPYTNKWTKKCSPNTTYPYSDKLCKSLESQGWGYNEYQ